MQSYSIYIDIKQRQAANILHFCLILLCPSCQFSVRWFISELTICFSGAAQKPLAQICMGSGLFDRWMTLSTASLCVVVCVFAEIRISNQSMNRDFVLSAVGDWDCGQVVIDVSGPVRVLDVFREMVLFSIAWVLVILMLQIMLLSLCVLALTEN